MTDEEIIEMAKRAGLHVATDVNWMPVIGLEYAKKLVEMATQHEREACAKLAENYMKETNSMQARGCLASVAYNIRHRGEA